MNPLYIAYDFHPLKFFKPATTSRDTLTIKPTWFIQLADEKPLPGVGEISIIEGLSVESERDIHLLLSRWILVLALFVGCRLYSHSETHKGLGIYVDTEHIKYCCNKVNST